MRRLVVVASICALSTSSFAYAGESSGAKLSVESELLGLHALQVMSKVPQTPRLVSSSPRLLRKLADNLARQKSKAAVLNELGNYRSDDRMAVAWALTHSLSNSKPTVTVVSVSAAPSSIGQDPPPDPKDVPAPVDTQNPAGNAPAVKVVTPANIALHLDYRVSWDQDGNGVRHMVYDHYLSVTLHNSAPYQVYYDSGGLSAAVRSCGYWFYTCSIPVTFPGGSPVPNGPSNEYISLHTIVHAVATLGFSVAGQTFALSERTTSEVSVGTSNCLTGSAHGALGDPTGVFIWTG